MRTLPSTALVAACIALAGCGEEPQSARAARAAQRESEIDRPLAAYRIDLLDLAFRAASAFPLDPHHKNRARTQESVVVACLELDQPTRASRYAASIENWRQGVCYADTARYLIEHGRPEEAEPYLDLAAAAADEEREAPNFQEWRRDRVRSKIAAAYWLMGRAERAVEFSDGLEPGEEASALVARSRTADDDQFAADIASVDRVFASQPSFAALQTALAVCAALHDRYYDHESRRDAAAQRLRDHAKELPPRITTDLYLRAADAAIDHADLAAAAVWIDEVRRLLEGVQWSAELEVQYTAELAKRRHRIGETEAARRMLGAAMERYAAARDEIVDGLRAGVIRPVAETYALIGDEGQALSVYEIAIEEGTENPNARPRAIDLADTCCSMAKYQVEPPAELMMRLREIYDGLVDPW